MGLGDPAIVVLSLNGIAKDLRTAPDRNEKLDVIPLFTPKLGQVCREFGAPLLLSAVANVVYIVRLAGHAYLTRFERFKGHGMGCGAQLGAQFAVTLCHKITDTEIEGL